MHQKFRVTAGLTPPIELPDEPLEGLQPEDFLRELFETVSGVDVTQWHETQCWEDQQKIAVGGYHGTRHVGYRYEEHAPDVVSPFICIETYGLPDMELRWFHSWGFGGYYSQPVEMSVRFKTDKAKRAFSRVFERVYGAQPIFEALETVVA